MILSITAVTNGEVVDAEVHQWHLLEAIDDMAAQRADSEVGFDDGDIYLTQQH